MINHLELQQKKDEDVVDGLTDIDEDIEESSDIGRGHSDITPAITECHFYIYIIP